MNNYVFDSVLFRRYITKHLMSVPSGNSEGNIEILGKTKPTNSFASRH